MKRLFGVGWRFTPRFSLYGFSIHAKLRTSSRRILGPRRTVILAFPIKKLEKLTEKDFDDLVMLASYICETPIALISLLDERRQWFKAKVGLDVSETAKEMAFCNHAILQSEMLAVRDALEDERFVENPLLTGDPEIRFYAGAQLLAPGGQPLGT